MEKKKKTGPDECCRAERQIGYEVRTLNQVIGRLVNSYQSKVDEKAGINRMQGWIIGYLYRHSEEAVFQKDLEAEFQMARSTASGILQAMEKKGLITREPIPRDARLKRLVLTEKGMEFQMEIMENFDRIQKVAIYLKSVYVCLSFIAQEISPAIITVSSSVTSVFQFFVSLST